MEPATEKCFPAWAGQPPVIAENEISETIAADVVVVGSGNAGVLAATAAAFAGASVSVIEQQSCERLHMYGLADVGTLNSKWAESNGVPHIDEAEFIAEWQHRTQNRSDPRLIAQFAYHSGEMLDWLLSMMSPMLTGRLQVSNYPCPFQRYDGEVSGFKTWAGTCELHNWDVGVRQVIAQAEAKGAAWYWENSAVVLTKQDGRVTGCIAKTKDGRFVHYTAKKGVILCTGDFGANHEMYVHFHQEIVMQFESMGLDTGKLRTMMGRDGIGQRMAVWAGGSMEPGPYACIYPTAGAPAHGVDANLADWNGGGQTAGFQGTSFLRLNDKGQRYCDEGIMGIYGILHRTYRNGGGLTVSVFDAQWFDYVQSQCHEHFMPYKNDLLWAEKTKVALAKALEAGKQGIGNGRGKESNLFAANSLPELADALGFKGEEKKNFLASIERYNEMCRQGKDTDFGKDPKLLLPVDQPPFYGLKTILTQPDTGLVGLNGVITDENQAVLGKNFKPIPGLFASGTCGGGKFFLQYPSVMAGMAVGSAMTFGMLAGRHVAGL
jgi:succinate dehydrogenase/fumarate reductase flavoprotein subunit